MAKSSGSGGRGSVTSTYTALGETMTQVLHPNGDADIYNSRGQYVTTVLGKLTPKTTYIVGGASTTRRGGRRTKEDLERRTIPRG